MRLTSPKFNLMGDAEDTRLMVDHVMDNWPASSYLAMVGISAGSGLLITYLGKVLNSLQRISSKDSNSRRETKLQ